MTATDLARAANLRGIRAPAALDVAALSRPGMPLAVVVAAALIGFGWLAVLLLRRADALAAGYDQTFFQQLVWNISTGQGFESSFSRGTFLGLHFSPLLVLPASIELIWPDARVLSLLHAGAIGLAVVAAFVFLRAAFRPSPGAGLLAAALAAPIPLWSVTQQIAWADFHTEVLALPLVLLAGWAGLTGRRALMVTLAVLALLAREDQGFSLAVMGLFIGGRARGGRRSTMRVAGLLLAVGGLAWTVIVFGLVMPALRGGLLSDTELYYRWLGTGVHLFLAPLEQPGRFFDALLRPDAWLVGAGLVLSVGGLPLLRPWWLLPIAVAILPNVLSRHWPQYVLQLHYGLLLIVPVLIAAAAGGRRALALAARLRRAHPGERLAPLALAGLVVGPAVAIGVLSGRLPPLPAADPLPFSRVTDASGLRAISSQVPAAALLVTDPGLGPVLANRARIGLLPRLPAEGYLLIERDAWRPDYLAAAQRDRLVAQLAANGRRLLIDDGRFQLWGPIGA